MHPPTDRPESAPRAVIDAAADILVVDESPVVREHVARVLARRGARVARAATPLDAVVQIVAAPTTLRVVVLGDVAEAGAGDALRSFSDDELTRPLVVRLHALFSRSPRERPRRGARAWSDELLARIDARLDAAWATGCHAA